MGEPRWGGREQHKVGERGANGDGKMGQSLGQGMGELGPRSGWVCQWQQPPNTSFFHGPNPGPCPHRPAPAILLAQVQVDSPVPRRFTPG